MYDELESILTRALEAAAYGKGRERHSKTPKGKDIPFIEQKIITLGKLIGPEGPAYQACKKITEGLTLRDKENGKKRCVEELLGAIVYTAAAIYIIENE